MTARRCAIAHKRLSASAPRRCPACRASCSYRRGQGVGRPCRKTARSVGTQPREQYAFDDMDGWRLLGYESLEEWLGDPAVGLTRTHFFRLTGLWRELVVERGVPHAGLRGVDMDKLDTALPAVKRGEVEPDEAIADAHALSRSDLQQKYQPSADNAYYCQTH